MVWPAAHKRGLVHRDLKPENIMLTNEGGVKILDFGLARSIGSGDMGESERKTDPGMIAGTCGYMSPEQAKAANADYRSDQFSFGAILYEMLTATPAFMDASAFETMFMVVRDEPPPLSQVAPAGAGTSALDRGALSGEGSGRALCLDARSGARPSASARPSVRGRHRASAR